MAGSASYLKCFTSRIRIMAAMPRTRQARLTITGVITSCSHIAGDTSLVSDPGLLVMLVYSCCSLFTVLTLPTDSSLSSL